MDLSFTPLQEELRGQARAFLEATPRPTWARSSPSSAGPARACRRSTAGGPHVPRGGRPPRGGGPRAAARAALVDVLLLPSCPGATRRQSPAGEASWTLALGPLVPDLDTAANVAVVGGDTIWELDGASGKCSATSDETRPLGVVSGGEAGRELCSSDVLPSPRSRSLAILALEAVGVGARRLELTVGYVATASSSAADRHGQAVSHPLASSHAEIELARSLAWWAAWCVAHDEVDAPVAAAAAKADAADAAVLGVRARNPGARRNRLHLGARAAPAVQARALDPVLGGVTGTAPSRGRRSSARPRRDVMQGLMMDYQLNVPAILRRGDELYGDREIVSRLPDKSWHRYGYADFASRAKRLAVALRGLGLEDGDRVGTLMWNHHEHLETYVGAPVGGFVTHTLNLRLHRRQHVHRVPRGRPRAGRRQGAVALAAQFVDRVGFEHVIAVGAGDSRGAIDFEELIASADESAYCDIDERQAAAMCFTSGTTGKPKGVVYSHRAIAIHALTAVSLLGITEGDTVLPVVPMFHANAWCFLFSCTLVGAKQVFPGPHLDPQSLLEAFESEKVTVSAGVPTIWMGILQALDGNPAAGTFPHADDDGRRLGAPPRDDRGVRRPSRPAHHARLGHDGDVPDRHDLGSAGTGAGPGARRRLRQARAAGPPDPLRRDPRTGRWASCPGTARAWASSRCAARRFHPPTSRPPMPPTAGRTTGGSRRGHRHDRA